MINYTVEESKGAFGFLNTFYVYEKSTGQVIKSFDPHEGDYIVNRKKDAQRLASHLNAGGGFDGCTPAFFLTPVTFPPQDDGDEE
jgi:hypothetical protein